MKRASWYTVEWRGDGSEWQDIATFKHQGSANAWALDVAGRPCTGDVRVRYRGAVVATFDCYTLQKQRRDAARIAA